MVLRVAAIAPWWSVPNVKVNVTAFGLDERGSNRCDIH